jgi:hypothetical protein
METRSAYRPRREGIETTLTRSPSVRINLGFKAWSTLSAMLLSLVVISGCNDEGASTTATPPANPGTPPVAKPAELPKKTEPTPPPPSTPKADDKTPEKK